MHLCRSFLVVLAAATAGFAQSVFPVRDAGEERDRTYHVLHYAIQISIDDREKEVTGRVTTTLVPYLPALSTVEFDAEQMSIRRVTINGRDLRFEVETGAEEDATIDLTLEEMEKLHIERVLRAEKGQVESASRRLGIPRSSLYQKIKRFGIIVSKG